MSHAAARDMQFLEEFREKVISYLEGTGDAPALGALSPSSQVVLTEHFQKAELQKLRREIIFDKPRLKALLNEYAICHTGAQAPPPIIAGKAPITISEK